MHILWLKSDLLLPLDKGGKLRTWHLMRHLARRHDITYLSFAGARPRMDDLASMREVAARVVTVPREEAAKGSWRFYADAARHVAHSLPYAVGKYRSSRFRAALATLLRERHFDLIVCDFLVPAVNLPRQLPCPAVLFTHNVEAEIWRRHAALQTSAIGRWLYGLQHRRMLRFERRVLRRFDHVLAVSESDRDTFTRLYPGAIEMPPFVIPTGVDTDYFRPSDAPPREPRLVFTGSMDWLPNEDAMRFFCQDVLPRIRLQEPSVRLTIVGREPTPAVLRLAAQADVEVTGRVEDVRPYMREAAVYIVPLRIGGGTRLKIFEAMAMGMAVVSTSVGAEGLPVVHDEHVAIADTPGAFSEAVLRLLRDERHRRRLQRAARQLVESRYDWSAAAAELETALVQAARPEIVTTTQTMRHRRTAKALSEGRRPSPAGRPGIQL